MLSRGDAEIAEDRLCKACPRHGLRQIWDGFETVRNGQARKMCPCCPPIRRIAAACLGLGLVYFPLPYFLAHMAFIFFISGLSLISLPGHWLRLS